MHSLLRLPALALSGLLLSACQMETGTPPISFEEMQAARLAQSMAAVEACRASECGRLDLDSGLMEDYGVIADMTHVTALMMSFTDFETLGDIAAMTQLRELHIGVTRVSNIDGIGALSGLKLLHIQDNPIDDYTPLAALRGLEELAMGNSEAGDLRYLSGLRRLRALNLDNAAIDSFEGLRGHPSLQTLDLVDAALPADLSPLLSIPNLREVTVSDFSLSPEQQAVIDQLAARGVEIVAISVVVVC